MDPETPSTREPAARVPSPAAAVLLFVVALIANVGLSIGFSALSLDENWFLVATPLLLLALTVAAVNLLRLDARKTLLLRLPSASDAIMALPLAISFVVLSDQLSALTQELVPIPEELAESMRRLVRVESGAEWALKLATIGFLAAMSEELLFRGFIQNGLLRGMGRTAAVLWTSFMFMVMHILPLPSFAAAGIVLGLVALSTRSILVPAIVHLVNNVSALALMNLGGLDTLADPVWIPPTILLPAVAIFVLTMGHFARRLLPDDLDLGRDDEEREPAESSPFEPRTAVPTRPPTIRDELSRVPTSRRRLGWLVVALAVVVGTTVLGGVFFATVYAAFPREVHAGVLDTLERESADRMSVSAYDRAPELAAAFDALQSVNDAGGLTWRDVWTMARTYSELSVDGEIDGSDVDRMVATIQEIIVNRTAPRRL